MRKHLMVSAFVAIGLIFTLPGQGTAGLAGDVVEGVGQAAGQALDPMAEAVGAVAKGLKSVFGGLGEKKRKKKPDLAVTEMTRTPDGRVKLTIANEGPGYMPPQVWNEPPHPSCKAVLYRNGKPWMQTTIRDMDPDGQLFYPDCFIVHTTRSLPAGTSKLRLVLDPGGRVREKRTGNNVMARTFKLGRPNLTVSRLSLTPGGRVQIGLKNLGPGDLPEQVWSSKAGCSLSVYRGGEFWGGANLRVIDPEKRLKRQGGGFIYTSNLRVRDQAEIKAVVDKENRVIESNELDNTLEKVLRYEPPSRCDLTVSQIFLTPSDKVSVTVKNLGPGEVPEEVWTSKADCSVFLYRDGKSWGGANLKVLDAGRQLMSKGGEVTFTSNLQLEKTTRIKAVVDKENRVREENEGNNSLVKTLSPGETGSSEKKPLQPLKKPLRLPRSR